MAIAAQLLAACYVGGVFGVPKSKKKAIDLYTRAADLGDSWAMMNLGLLSRPPGSTFRLDAIATYPAPTCRYVDGVGLGRKPAKKYLNHEKGIAYYRRAAELGNPHAQHFYACDLASGERCERDVFTAVRSNTGPRHIELSGTVSKTAARRLVTTCVERVAHSREILRDVPRRNLS